MQHTSMASLLLVLLLAGCGDYRTDLETICRVHEKVDATSITDPEAKATQYAGYLASHIKSIKGRELWQSLAPLEPAQKIEKLERAAREANLDCPAAKMIWAAPVVAPPAAPPEAPPTAGSAAPPATGTAAPPPPPPPAPGSAAVAP